MTYDSSDVYWKRKDSGRCVRCGKPHPDVLAGKSMCPECARKNNEYVLGIRALRKARGICTNCGSRPPRPGRTMCFECARLSAEYSKIQYKKRKARNESQT